MSRKPKLIVSEIERFQVSFNPGLTGEYAFLKAWFMRPWGRRQSWARGILNLGLQARLSGSAHANDEMSADVMGGDSNFDPSTPSHSVTLTLKRKSPDEMAALTYLDLLPYGRRVSWLRETLLDGYLLSCRLPLYLAQPRSRSVNDNVNNSAPDKIPETLAESLYIKNGKHIQSLHLDEMRPKEDKSSPPSFNKLGQINPRAGKIKAKQGKNLAKIAEPAESSYIQASNVSSEPLKCENKLILDIDIDLSDLATKENSNESATENNAEPLQLISKRPELRGLFQ